ncbi:MAG: acetyl-CoA acetyltransferase family protein [Planctomycetota bacterium]|jgi:acetyl-CoA acetyltransferase family protein
MESRGKRIVLAAGLRLPQVKAGGAYGAEDAGHLGASVARELLARTAIDPSQLDEVIVGCVGPPHDQANIGRVIGLRAGVPRSVPGYTVGRNCASGMQAVTDAITRIQAGNGELFMCVGTEAMSAYPLHFNQRATRFFSKLSSARSLPAKLSAIASLRPSMLAPRIAIVEGLTDPTNGLIMGKTAERLVRDFGITRDEVDAFALESHRRARIARDKGRFAREIVPFLPLGKKGAKGSMVHDDGIRDNQSMTALGRMRPYFDKPDGVVTIGNACGISDGATALIITTEERARELGMTPLAAIRSHAWAGCDPSRMGLGPVFSSVKALEQAGVEFDDVGVIEINEAFAAQVIACRRAFASDSFAREHLGRDKAIGHVSPERLNRNGGAIALGHPVGATGARLLLTTAHEMILADQELGLATLCIGGGQGGAVVLERIAT